MQYHIYAMIFPFDLRCESVTCIYYCVVKIVFLRTVVDKKKLTFCTRNDAVVRWENSDKLA